MAAFRSDFNSRPRVGGDSVFLLVFAFEHDFNSRPRVGGDAADDDGYTPQYLFQFTPPRRGRLHLQRDAGGRPDFNSRPRVGGDIVSTSSGCT